MSIKNIETSYGKFPTLFHFEHYWEKKRIEAFKEGFEEGVKFIQGEKE